MNMTQPPNTPSGAIPWDIACALDYESAARKAIPVPAYEYIVGGSGQGLTAAANLSAFREWSVYPRLLRDVTAGHTRVKLLGREFPHPILLAPVALQKLAHPQGELETARGADAVSACMTVSTQSSFTLEDIARAAPFEKWFQLYVQPRREHTLDLVQRAEKAGYTAIVWTLDAPVQVRGLRAQRAGFKLPEDAVPANLAGYPPRDSVTLGAADSRVFQAIMREAPTWDDLEWLLKQTRLPVLVKGVLHAEDARALQARGVAGVVVSNHGGRGLDGAPASLHALAAVRAAVGDDYPLLLDGGIRSGLDVFKALALGADAVMIGRLQIYGLSVAGALGVGHAVKLLREELEACMALAGCATPLDIRRATLQRAAAAS